MPTKKHTTGKIDPIDIYLGERLRIGRKLRKVSQGALGKMNGLTFQQIQKYEQGRNRISASTLVRIAHSLNLSLIWFLGNLPVEGLDEDANSKYPPVDMKLLNEREVQQLLSAYFGIADKGERRFFRQIMTRMASPKH